jgi:hypothetical protein
VCPSDGREDEPAWDFHWLRSQSANTSLLAGAVRKGGQYYYWISRCIDHRPVCANRIRKSTGAENTFSLDLMALEDMHGSGCFDPMKNIAFAGVMSILQGLGLRSHRGRRWRNRCPRKVRREGRVDLWRSMVASYTNMCAFSIDKNNRNTKGPFNSNSEHCPGVIAKLNGGQPSSSLSATIARFHQV